MLPTTEGSTVTRAAETASKTGLSNYINSNKGVLYADIAALSDDQTFRLITLSDGSNSSKIVIGYRSNSNAIYLHILAQNVSKVLYIHSLSDIKQFHKVAVLFEANNTEFWVDGVKVYFNNISYTLSGMNKLAFDDGSGAYRFIGKVKDLKVYKTTLTDAELTTLTTL
jgi:hypothetical protein